MARILYQYFSVLRRNQRCVLLAFFMAAGFLAGIRISAQIPFSASLMRGLFSSPVSIVPSLCAALIPFLFSAFAVYFTCPNALFPLAFLRCAAYGFISGGITRWFGEGGWLVRWLTLFHSSLCVPVLAVYWFRHIRGDLQFSWGDTTATLALTVFAVWLDFRYILPLLASI